MVDDNGKLLGGVEKASSELSWLVSLGAFAGSGFVVVENILTGQFHLNSVFFTTTDCSGQAYVERIDSGGLYPGIDDGLGLSVTSDGTLYAATSVTTALVNYQSRLSPGSCAIQSGSTQLLTGEPVGNFATEFTPPFHIVTAESQAAAVPIHFGWLLGGILLGLGIKAVGRQGAL